ncbi:unnamed protein product [Mytilus coruscus]|uniref:Uncharacterized protein n=1 Tax=Mytilus coruscus TaxID=42192 RepID=A0A6J8C1J6_MYTCO|nr:unnamed protein product [Mytilus coruscus]
MEAIKLTCFSIVGLLLSEICQGLSIDLMEPEVSDCVNPSVKMVCKFTPDELQAASNELTIMHGGLTLANCKSDSLPCTTASVLYNVTMEAARAVLTITNMDAFYYGPIWGCRAGPKVASLQLKYFRAATESASEQFLSLGEITIVDLLTLFIVIAILLILVVKLFCISRCQRGKGKDKLMPDNPLISSNDVTE